MTAIDNEVIKTLYWDSKEARFMYLVWNVKTLSGMPHKLPRSVHDEPAAYKYISDHNLG